MHTPDRVLRGESSEFVIYSGERERERERGVPLVGEDSALECHFKVESGWVRVNFV